MLKNIVSFFLSLLLLLCFSTIEAAAFNRTWEDAVTSEDVFYIPINDDFINVANSGTLFGWGISGVQVAECAPSSWDVDGTHDSAGNPFPDRSFDVKLANDTPFNTSFEVLVDVQSTATTCLVVNTGNDESTTVARANNYTVIRENNFKIPVSLNGDIGSLNLYVHRNLGGGGSQHLFNFSIAEPDGSDDPSPADVVSVDITAPPTRTEYIEGQKFDRSGMAVQATLTSGDVVPIYGYTVTPEKNGEDGRLAVGDTYVTISFGNDEDGLFEVPLSITVLPGTGISDVRISNGQMYFDWKTTDFATGIYVKKVREYDAVVLYGETAGKFSFLASEGAEVTASNGGQIEKIGEAVSAALAPDGATTVTVTAGGASLDYTFTCYQQIYPGMPVEVTEYICPASQYTNGASLGAYGLKPWAALRGKDLLSTAYWQMDSGAVSLGNFGGYIVFRYDVPITDDPNNPYGVDFIVYGNSVDPRRGFAEPGNVLVSKDGETWYALAGSAHYEDYAKWGYSMTYKKNQLGKSEIWVGGEKIGTGDKYPMKTYYPLFPWDEYPNSEEEMTFTGVALDNGGVTDEHGSAAAAFPDFGYADTGPRSESSEAGNPYVGIYFGGSHIDWETRRQGADGFDLKWAVDGSGQPVDLSEAEIRYIKIQCANNVGSGGGGIGEKSTEINGMRVAASADVAVGTTSAPASITIDNEAITLDGSNNNVYAAVVAGGFMVDVETDAEHVYINGNRGASRAFPRMPGHEMLRVIVQNGDQEPWIGYFNLSEEGDDDDVFSEVTFDPAGGSITGALTRTYMSGMPDEEKIFPIPERFGHTFLGWFDEEGIKREEYDEDMPEALTLTADWRYDKPDDNAGGGYGSVLTYDGDRPAITLSDNTTVRLPFYVGPLLLDDPHGGMTDDTEGDIYTYGAIDEVLKISKKDETAGVYVSNADNVLRGMDASERRALGLNTYDNPKLLELPHFRATVTQASDAAPATILVSTKVTFGAAFDGTKLGSIVPLKTKPDGKTVMLNWQPDPTKIRHGEYAWTELDGTKLPETTTVYQDSEAYISVAITDNSDLDWDETKNSVLDPILLASGASSNTTATNSAGGGYEAGGGCNAGLLGLAGIGLLASIAAARRRGRG